VCPLHGLGSRLGRAGHGLRLAACVTLVPVAEQVARTASDDGTAYVSFRAAFTHNAHARSRTLQGIDDPTSTPGKPPLLKAGPALARHADRNLDAVIRDVWEEARRWAPAQGESAARIQVAVERWNGLVNEGLEQPHEAEHRALREQVVTAVGGRWARRLADDRYRSSTPGYCEVSPLDVPAEMRAFYQGLAWRALAGSRGRVPLAEILAWADWELDHRIHPFPDGCGRTATAVVMWLSHLATGGRSYPRFPPRAAHHASFDRGRLTDHVEYFRTCLEPRSAGEGSPDAALPCAGEAGQ
jgi:hypothetical protein